MLAAHGTTLGQIAAAAAKNHTNAVDNPRAQCRIPVTVEEVVLEDRVVAALLTRAICAPTGDAAAAVVVCSGSSVTSSKRG